GSLSCRSRRGDDGAAGAGKGDRRDGTAQRRRARHHRHAGLRGEGRLPLAAGARRGDPGARRARSLREVVGMGRGVGIKEVAWFDCPGGGQIVVDGDFAYIGHMEAPFGTSTLDVRDPAKPRKVAEIAIPPGFHSHKVRVANELMLVNRELHGRPAEGAATERGGLIVYDVRDPRAPREITRWRCDGSGVHRFTFDGRYAYISPE